MHSSFIAVFLAVLAPMTVLAWHPHGPPPKHDHWQPGGLEHPGPSATASVSAAPLPAGSSIPAGILPSSNFLPTGVSGVLAGSTGGAIDRVRLHRGANSTDTLIQVAAPAATATASVGLTSYE